MKNKSLAYIAELAMRGSLAGAALAVMLGYIWGDGFLPLFTGFGICLFAAFFFAFVRSKTSRFGLFFIWHIVFCVATVALVPGVAAKVMCAVVLAVLVGDSVYQIKKSFNDGNRLHFGMAVIFIFASYAAGYKELPVLEQSCFVMTAVFMALYFMRTGFYNTQQFIEHNDNGRGTPLKDIKLRSYSLVGGFATVVGVFMVAVRYMGGETIIKHIGNALYAIGSAFARWLIYQLQGEYVANPETGEEADMFGFVKEAFEERNVPAFVELIEKLIRYFFIAAIIIGVIALLIWLVFKLYSVFGEKKNGKRNTVAEFVSPVKTDKTARQKLYRKNSTLLQNKARRYYKKYIVKNLANKELSQAKTPYEISAQLGLDKKDGDGEIRRIYEKARYSNQECSKEEIKAIKEYVKGNKR